MDQVQLDKVLVDEVLLDNHDRGSVTAATPSPAETSETAGRRRAAVSLYVAGVVAAGAAGLAFALRAEPGPFPAALVPFILLAAIADLREVRLPGVGVVTLSFVLVLASLIAFGLWQALLVAAASGAATAWLTRDPQKVAFNVGNHMLSTFLAGLVYLAVVPPGEITLTASVLPAYAATGVDFLANTVVLTGVLALATGDRPLAIWQRNYQWGLPSYLTGAALSLLVAFLYLELGMEGLLLGIPPLYLIYHSYEVYVGRVRERESHTQELASFAEELRATGQLHEELRSAQVKVAAEIERARRIQQDLLPKETPRVKRLELAPRIEFMSEMGGDYYDFLAFPDGRLGIVCGDVMGKGLAAALIMAMARSLIHSAATPDRAPSAVLAEVNDGLARDLEGQQLPYFLTLVYAIWTPARRELVVAGAGHNPLLVFDGCETQRVASQGTILGVRLGVDFPEDVLKLRAGDLFALYTDGLSEARAQDGELFGPDRLARLLEAFRYEPLDETLAATWEEVGAFRGGAPASDDATLILARVT